MMSLLKVAEAAKELGCSPSLVYQAISEGRLQCHRIGEGRRGIRVSREQLDSFLDGDSGRTDLGHRPAGEPGTRTALDRDDAVLERLDQIDVKLAELLQQRTAKNWYGTAEFAKLVGKAEFTVREWCRLGRIHAEKRACGRGKSQEWMISQAELTRYQNEGLRPVPTVSTKY